MIRFDKNPYIMTNWSDHIIDMEHGDIIQEGTRFTASRANNIEEGIFNSYNYIKLLYEDLTRLIIQLEMIGRVPVNNGTFFDPIGDESSAKSLELLKEMTVLQLVKRAGETSLEVEDGSLFQVGEVITLIDDTNQEDVKIIGRLENTLSVSALINDYKKGALVVRTNGIVKGNKLYFGNWGNYSVSIKGVD